MFQDYHINGLESNRVYELYLGIPDNGQQPIQSDVKGDSLQMMVTPTNATVTIWGDNEPRKTYRLNGDGTLKVYLPYGRYSYKVMANDYHSTEGNVFVDDNDTWETVQLQPIMGTITISCPTTRTAFYVNSQMVKPDNVVSTWTGQLRPGEYVVEARKNGYVSQSNTIMVMADKDTFVTFERLTSQAEVNKLEQQRIDEEKKRQRAEQKAREDSLKAVNDSIEKARNDSIAKEQVITKLKQDSIEAEKKREQNILEAARRAAKRQLQQQKRDSLYVMLARKDRQSVVWGVVAGFNSATASFSSNYEGDTGSLSGFHLGVTLDLRVGNGIYLGTGLIYSAKGYTFESNNVEEEGNPQFIDIPLQLSARIPLGKLVKWQISAGPYAALCIGGKVKDNMYGSYDESFSSAYSGFDYGLQMGTRLYFRHHYHFGISYQTGMGSNYQNRNLMLGIGYCF